MGKSAFFALFLVFKRYFFFSCSQMGQSFSNLLMDIHLGMLT